MGERYFSDKIVEWYLENKRNLPWRETTDPYRIWLSEIILQQTRVNQGLPYYLRFIEKFPNVKALAAASEEEVLRLWQGLGYYTRARNLKKCAMDIADNHQGVFPDSFESLKKLCGIGEYTAAAIASFAFEKPVAVVDGNVFRVLSRVFGVDKDIASSEGKAYFFQLANKLIDKYRPGLHNQAVMEFGALYCTPQQPMCDGCIFEKICIARSKGIQLELPVKQRLKSIRKRYFYYFVLQQNGKIALKRRDGKDIWKGLYDFHLVEKNRPADPLKMWRDNLPFRLPGRHTEPTFISPPYKHVLTHQIIHARFIVVDGVQKSLKKNDSLKFYSKKAISALPKPVLISRFLDDAGIL